MSLRLAREVGQDWCTFPLPAALAASSWLHLPPPLQALPTSPSTSIASEPPAAAGGGGQAAAVGFAMSMKGLSKSISVGGPSVVFGDGLLMWSGCLRPGWLPKLQALAGQAAAQRTSCCAGTARRAAGFCSGPCCCTHAARRMCFGVTHLHHPLQGAFVPARGAPARSSPARGTKPPASPPPATNLPPAQGPLLAGVLAAAPSSSLISPLTSVVSDGDEGPSGAPASPRAAAAPARAGSVPPAGAGAGAASPPAAVPPRSLSDTEALAGGGAHAGGQEEALRRAATGLVHAKSAGALAEESGEPVCWGTPEGAGLACQLQHGVLQRCSGPPRQMTAAGWPGCCALAPPCFSVSPLPPSPAGTSISTFFTGKLRGVLSPSAQPSSPCEVRLRGSQHRGGVASVCGGSQASSVAGMAAQLST